MLERKRVRVRGRKTKNQKATIKIDELEPGHVAQVRVRCGKPNCRCARGQRHVAHYHVWRSGGVRYRRYVRKADVLKVQQACTAHRELQAELRAGRTQYRRMLTNMRELFRRLA